MNSIENFTFVFFAIILFIGCLAKACSSYNVQPSHYQIVRDRHTYLNEFEDHDI